MIYFFVVISLMSFFLPKRQLHEGQCCVLSIICLQHLEKCLACRKYRICWLNGWRLIGARFKSGENDTGHLSSFFLYSICPTIVALNLACWVIIDLTPFFLLSFVCFLKARLCIIHLCATVMLKGQSWLETHGKQLYSFFSLSLKLFKGLIWARIHEWNLDPVI